MEIKTLLLTLLLFRVAAALPAEGPLSFLSEELNVRLGKGVVLG